MKRFTTAFLLRCASVLAVFSIGGCTTFDGAEESAVQNFEEGTEGRGRLISPNQMGDRFGSYYE